MPSSRQRPVAADRRARQAPWAKQRSKPSDAPRKRPAPHPLDRIDISLTPEGQLVVDKGEVYRMVPDVDPDVQHPESLLKG